MKKCDPVTICYELSRFSDLPWRGVSRILANTCPSIQIG
jgi:hypothetical protein